MHMTTDEQRRKARTLRDLHWVRLFFVGGPTSLCGGVEAAGSWIR